MSFSRKTMIWNSILPQISFLKSLSAALCSLEHAIKISFWLYDPWKRSRNRFSNGRVRKESLIPYAMLHMFSNVHGLRSARLPDSPSTFDWQPELEPFHIPCMDWLATYTDQTMRLTCAFSFKAELRRLFRSLLLRNGFGMRWCTIYVSVSVLRQPRMHDFVGKRFSEIKTTVEF